jgi:hypothetical protein
MNSTEILTLVGLLLAIVAAAIALWQGYLLRRQIEYGRQVNQVDLYFRVASVMKDVDIFFADRPDIKPYFYHNKRPRGARQRHQMESVAEMFIDLAECVIACQPGLGPMAFDWHKYFTFLYRNSPALRAVWEEYSYYYPDSVRNAFGAPAQKPSPSYSDAARLQFSASSGWKIDSDTL